MYQQEIVQIIKNTYGNQDFTPLHVPKLGALEKEYLSQCIDSTFVSSVGQFVTDFENKMAQVCGAQYAVATSNGTSALHAALHAVGVKHNDEVLTQAVTFVATTNAIAYCSASPIFIDSEWETMGMCADKLEEFLTKNTEMREGHCFNKLTGKRISACVPMHVFGHPVKLNKILALCKKHNITLIEDSAEALGSYEQGKHVGFHGEASILSFNGNKIITTGGGGMILTNNKDLALKLKHITTTAKVPHKWEFEHDQLGFNYRLPNLNAALGMAQMAQFETFRQTKREIAAHYAKSFAEFSEVRFVKERAGTEVNYWLNCLIFKDAKEKEDFLHLSNSNGVMTRPLWKLMSEQPMYKNCPKTNLDIAQDIYNRLVNIPSSVY